MLSSQSASHRVTITWAEVSVCDLFALRTKSTGESADVTSAQVLRLWSVKTAQSPNCRNPVAMAATCAEATEQSVTLLAVCRVSTYRYISDWLTFHTMCIMSPYRYISDWLTFHTVCIMSTYRYISDWLTFHTVCIMSTYRYISDWLTFHTCYKCLKLSIKTDTFVLVKNEFATHITWKPGKCLQLNTSDISHFQQMLLILQCTFTINFYFRQHQQFRLLHAMYTYHKFHFREHQQFRLLHAMYTYH